MRNKWIWGLGLFLTIGFLVLHLGCSRQPIHDQVNADGVRPEVAAEIAKAYPNSAKRRAVATQMAAAVQKAIENPDDAMEIYKNYFARTFRCAWSIFPDPKPFPDLAFQQWPTILGGDLVLNTYDRSKAYIHFEAGLSGHILGGDVPDSNSCDFDPSKLAD